MSKETIAKDKMGKIFQVKTFNGFFSILREELFLCHKHKFLIPISLKMDCVNLWYFKLRLFN